MGSALVLGIIEGLTVAFLAVGLALVYKASRFINLAHAQIGTYSAVLLAKLVLDAGAPWLLAFVVALVVGIATAIGTERLIIRPLRSRGASTVAMLLATIGVAQLLSVLEYIPVLGPKTQDLTLKGYPTPFETHIKVAGVVLTGEYVLTLTVVPVVVAALALFLRFTAMGKMIRAAASNPDAARLAGVSISRVSLTTWGIAGALAAVTAVLRAPSQPSFDAASLGPDLLLRALGAAAVGGFASIPGALVGGMGIGIVEQLALYWTHSGGKADLIVFLAIIVIMLVRGNVISAATALQGDRAPGSRPLVVPDTVTARNFVRHRRRLLGGLALFLGVVVPLLPPLRSEAQRFDLNLILVYALVGVSLTMVVGWAGQISLGHFALVGVGAYLTARLSPHGWSIPLLLVAAGLLGAFVMVLVGLPAVRIRGLTLAVTTLGFAVIAKSWLFNRDWFGSNRSFGLPVLPPGLSGLGRPSSQIAVYYIGLAVLVLTVLGAQGIRRSLPGRMVMAVRDNEGAAMSFGFTPATVKLAVLAVSGFIAAMAGVLWADAWQNISTSQFNPQLSLAVLAVPVVGGLGSVGGAVGAAVFLYGMSYFVGPHLHSIFGTAGDVGFLLIAGGLLQVLVVIRYPKGLAGAAQALGERFLARVADHESRRARDDEESPDALVAQGLRLSFGGVRALNDASITVRPGEIVGLIGPNGAGKSTLMNAVSGNLKAEGVVRMFGTDVTGMSPDLRWMHGLGRTFQDAKLFPSLTVRETVRLALRAADRPGFVPAMLRLPWVGLGEHRAAAAADDILERFGLTAYGDALLSELSTGTRRICDLAAQVAANPRLLLLDEPTAGVAQREAEVFAPLLRRIRDELGCAILIVEHDLPMLMDLCDRIYAMETGAVIAAGTPDEVRNDPRVIASYLGTNEAAVRRSGRATRTAATRPPRAPKPVPARAPRATASGTRRSRDEATPKTPR